MILRFRPSLALALLLFPSACFDDPNSASETSNDDATTGGDGDGDGDPSGDGDGDPSGDGDGDPSGDGDGDPTGADGCARGQDCLDPALVGWEGPLAVYLGPADQPPPTCQGDTPVKLAELFEGLTLNESTDTCVCECGSLMGASCGSLTLEQQSSCALGATTIASWNLTPNTCVAFGGLQASARYEAPAPPLNGGSCTPSVVEDIVEAKFANRIVACGVSDDANTCDGGVCLSPPEAPFDSRICVATQGDVQCPSGAYPERSVYYTGANDDRSCVDCGCSAPEGETCTGAVQITGNASCQVLLGNVNVGGCSNSIGSAAAARWVPAPITAECSPSEGAIQGGAEPIGAWTFCCQV